MRANDILAAIWCPSCWSLLLYVGAGQLACPEHGVVDPVSLANILLVVRGKLT